MNHSSSLFITLIILQIPCQILQSQEASVKELSRAIHEADISYYYDEDYARAASLYEPLVQSNPDNENLAVKLGICCLNIEGRKQEALDLLKKASKNIATDKKSYTENGEQAPVDTRFYLAIAYQVNDSLEKALSLFYEVKKITSDDDVARLDYIDLRIRDCRYAIEQKKKPLTIINELFAPWLTDYPGACNPVLSKNDSVFIFTQKTGETTKILCSYKNGTWQNPRDITSQLGGYNRLYSNSITGNGKFLVLFMDDGGDGNLYFSHRSDTLWSKVRYSGKPISTIYWESHGFITPDGQTMYLASNRPGGIGELDIWKSEKKADGTWENPVNLGEPVNTPYDEDTPFFDPSTGALVYSSAGLTSMGGYDVFRSVVRNGGWTNPVGMPYAFNTTSENKFFILNNNSPGFVASIYNEKERTSNIYSLVAVDPKDEITGVEGALTLNDGMTPDPMKASLRLTDISKKSQPKLIRINPDGSYKFSITPGDYELLASYPGYKPESVRLNLPLYFLSHYMVVNTGLNPDKVAPGSFLAIKNILFGYDSCNIDPQAIPVLESIKSILVNYPDLKIEIAGYTDSKGSSAYNLKLADRRAQAVIDFFTSNNIAGTRFVKKAFGESNFAAVNVNKDGTDNPEGRKYNRRVTFGIVDPQTGVVIRQDTYTPEYLRLPSSIKYSVIVKKSSEKVPSGYFGNLDLNGILYLKTLETDSLIIYSIGVFYNRSDAVRYLSYVKEKGYMDAYVANHYDMNRIIRESARLMPVVSGRSGSKIYTIQVKASLKPLNMWQFKDLSNIRELYNEDGYYRYVTGEYPTLAAAKKAVKPIIEAGFSDAFIRELNLLIIK